MDITFETASTDEQLEQILALQRANLFSRLSEKKQTEQGFVYAEHTLALLQRMASELPQVIASSDGMVVGYNLAMPVSMREEMPRLVPMFEEFDRCEYKGRPLPSYRYMVGGQVCVAKDFRGHGLLSRLYHETRDRLQPGFQLCVTEVAARNSRALQAHQKMGFEVVSTYHDGTDLWKVVVWDLERPAP